MTELMKLSPGGRKDVVLDEANVEEYLLDINNYPKGDNASGWNEGFVTGLDAAGVLTSNQYDDLMAYVARM